LTLTLACSKKNGVPDITTSNSPERKTETVIDADGEQVDHTAVGNWRFQDD
jgi:hypothetical protein